MYLKPFIKAQKLKINFCNEYTPQQDKNYNFSILEVFWNQKENM